MGGSYIAALVAFFALIAGSALISGWRGAEFSGLSDILFGRSEDGSLLKTALAWGWVALGLGAVAGAFLSRRKTTTPACSAAASRLQLRLLLCFRASAFCG